MSRDNRNSNSGGLGCAVTLMLCVVAMPLVGLYLAISGEESGQKILGVVLTIVGLILWIKLGMTG